MKTVSLRAAAIAAAFAAVVPLAAFAAADQPPPPPPPPGDMMGPPPGMPMPPPGMMMQRHFMMRMPGMMGPEMMGPHVEGRLAFVHVELKITPAQEGAWNKLADAVRANTRPHEMRMVHMGHGPGGADDKPGDHMMPMPPRMDLPARIEMHQKMLSEQMERLNSLKGPLLALYSVLSDEQKRGADMLVGMLLH